MDDFVKGAMDEIQRNDEEIEAEKYEQFYKDSYRILHVRVLRSIGAHASAKLICLASLNGLEDTLHNYARTMFMAGFSGGYQAGKETVLEKLSQTK